MAISLRAAGALLFMVFIAGCGTTSTSTRTPAQRLSNVLTTQQEADKAYHAGDLERSAALYLQLTKLIPQEADYWYMLGNTYVRMQQPDQAVLAYQQAILRNPNHARAWHNLGIVRLRQAEAAFVSSASTARADDPMRDLSSHLADDLAHINVSETKADKRSQVSSPITRNDVETITPAASTIPLVKGATDQHSAKPVNANLP